MVRKRGPYERIEKMTSKKRHVSNTPENTPSSSNKKVGINILNDHILSLYKKDIPLPENSLKNESLPLSEADCQENEKNEVQKTSTEENKSTRKSLKTSQKKSSPGFSIQRPTVTFKDVGGLDNILVKILRLFFHIRDPEVFSTLGAKQAAGFLLHGPPGCGKTHLAHAIAGELTLPLIEVAATELVCGISGESEGKIREIFDEAVKSAPCILFIDEIDVITPKRDSTDRGLEKRMVAQLLKSLDELKKRDNSSSVMVIGATNRPDSIDPALRRGLRFDTEFAIGIPDEKARLMILRVLTKKLRLSQNFDLEWLAHHTPGYVGADLDSLIAKGVTFGLERIYNKFFSMYLNDKGDQPSSDCSIHINSKTTLDSVLTWFKSEMKIPEAELDNIFFEQPDFEAALKDTIPFSKREGFSMVPNITWDDVGALKDIKEELQEAIIWPVKYGKLYENSNMESGKGILLYGPKGCGKTLLAKAIANECSINFLSVKGPELLNMYLGESERAVRQCFQRARNSAPCVIFFDELDALCPERTGSNANAAAERVVDMLLTEMDGMGERNQVFVIGATNRLDNIDSAMLRPGRLENIIFVGLPSPSDRVDILKSLTKNKTKPKMSDDVDLEVIGNDSRCENFSGADLAHLIRAASSKAIREHITSSTSCLSSDIVEVTLKHFEHAFSKVKPSVTERDKKYFQSISVQRL